MAALPATAGALSGLTWNICTWAPANPVTSRQGSYCIDQKLWLIADEIRQAAPSIVCLQEVGDTYDAALAQLLAPDYSRVCRVASHAGHTVLYIQPALQPRAEPPTPRVAIASIPLAAAATACGLPQNAALAAAAAAAEGSPLPAEATVAGGSGKQRAYVLGCHLIFGKDLVAKRVEQVEAALASLPPDARLVVLLGDTNFWGPESSQVEDLGPQPGLRDAFCQLGCPMQAAHTWDNITNDYAKSKAAGKRQYTARYDRIYLRSFVPLPGSMRLVGNQPVTPGRGDYLSDHFGVAVQFGLRFGLPADAEAAVAGQESAGQQPVVAASTNAEGEDQQVQRQQQAAAAAALASAAGAEDSRQPAAAIL